jgi:hypothetical protein
LPKNEEKMAFMKKFIAAIAAAAAVTALMAPLAHADSEIVYKNRQYGFLFYMPEDWRGYTVVESQWQGFLTDGTQGGEPAFTGPIVTIRDPRWTEDQPRQDIPIMVFTPGEWSMVQDEKLSVSAAPIPPTELGRNNKYVFALPARYNFAFLPGWEEVESILAGKPLVPIWNDQKGSGGAQPYKRWSEIGVRLI